LADQKDSELCLGDNMETLSHLNMIPDGHVLACHIRVDSNHIQSHLIRQIATSEMCEIHKAMVYINDFGSCCNLYEICERNYTAIVSFYNQLRTNYLQNRNRADEFIRDVVLEMDRLLLNYLASFKTFIDHLNTRYSRPPLERYSYRTDLEIICSNCYDTNFYYRFFSELRNYVQHCDLPVGYVDIKEDSGHIDISICFDRDLLLSRFRKWKSVKKDLLIQPEHFEIMPSLKELRSQIQLINDIVISWEVFIVRDSYVRLCNLINEAKALYPNGQVLIRHFKQGSNLGDPLQATNFPFHELRRFEEENKELELRIIKA